MRVQGCADADHKPGESFPASNSLPGAGPRQPLG